MRFWISIILLGILTFPLSATTIEGTQLEGEKSLASSPLLQDYCQLESAEAFFSKSQYASAIAAYSKLAANYPESILCPHALLFLGKSQYNVKYFSQAAKTFRGLIESYPYAKEVAEAHYLTGRALEKEKKWKEAYLAYEETDLFHPLDPFSQKARLAIRDLKRAHKKNLPVFKASAAALFKKGMAYYEEDDFDMATNIFSRLAREYPRSKYVSQAWLMLGKLELATGKASALKDLGRAAEDTSIADEALYWTAYYKEINDDVEGALNDYNKLIKQYPFSTSIPATLWRTGRIYYWSGDFRAAASYFHQAQLYPARDDTPRCLFFEAKAEERMGNKSAALELYKKLVERFDHTYYAYRAIAKIQEQDSSFYSYDPFSSEDFSEALNGDEDKLAAVLEIWEETNAELLRSQSNANLRLHLEKYKALMELGKVDYAAEEARYLIEETSDIEKDSAQTRLGEALMQSGQYRTPIRFAERKVRAAVIAGKPASVSKKIWHMAYPRGYWKQVSSKAGLYGVDPYFVLAVIREESRFNPKAVSRASARGLMQIMPKTGRGIAKDLDIARYRTSKLYDPALNIQMGSFFLSRLLKNFSNNCYLALAGYNGGPNRIKRYVNNWYNGDLSSVDIDEFIESIPVRETRLYVQKVMGSYFEYKRLYAGKRS